MEFSAEGYATQNEDAAETPFISIIVEEDRVKYDTNLSAQDMVFWMETVKTMLLNGVVSPE